MAVLSSTQPSYLRMAELAAVQPPLASSLMAAIHTLTADASPAPPPLPPPPDAGAASTGDREDGAEGGSGSGADGGVEGGTAADGAAAEGAAVEGAVEGAAAAPVWSETLAREHADPRCGRPSLAPPPLPAATFTTPSYILQPM